MIQSKYILSFTLYGILVFSNISFSWAESEKKTQFSLDNNTLYLCKITKHITLNDNGVIFEHENKAFNLLISEEKKIKIYPGIFTMGGNSYEISFASKYDTDLPGFRDDLFKFSASDIFAKFEFKDGILRGVQLLGSIDSFVATCSIVPSK